MAEEKTLQEIQSKDKSSEFFKKLNDNFEILNEKSEYKQLTTSDFADGAVTNSKIADGTITSDKIKDGEIKNADIADNTITSDKIKDNAITIDKLGADVKTGLSRENKIYVCKTKPSGNSPSITDIFGNSQTAKEGDVVIYITSQDS